MSHCNPVPFGGGGAERQRVEEGFQNLLALLPTVGVFICPPVGMVTVDLTQALIGTLVIIPEGTFIFPRHELNVWQTGTCIRAGIAACRFGPLPSSDWTQDTEIGGWCAEIFVPHYSDGGLMLELS